MDYHYLAEYDRFGRLSKNYPWDLMKDEGDTLTISGLRSSTANLRTLASRWRRMTAMVLSLTKIDETTMRATLVGRDAVPRLNPGRGRPSKYANLWALKVGENTLLRWERKPNVIGAVNARAINEAAWRVARSMGWKLKVQPEPFGLRVTRVA